MIRSSKTEIAQIVGRLTPAQRQKVYSTLTAQLRRPTVAPASTRQLVAFVSLDNGDGDVRKDLSEFLRERLPSYMVPARFVVLDALPRLPNGKIDRSQLSREIDRVDETGRGSTGEENPSRPPASHIEKLISEIWMAVLGIPGTDRTDHFFEIGGDSILSIQVVSRARMAGLPIEVTDLFEHPVLEDLAWELSHRAEMRSTAPPVAIEDTPEPDVIELTPIQQWFFDTVKTDQNHWNQSLYIEADASIELNTIVEALRLLPARHDALRLRFPVEDQHRVGRLADSVSVNWPVEVVELAGTHAEQTIARKIGDDQRRFDLGGGPLGACTVFHREQNEPNLITIILHHLVVDYTSARLIVDDLANMIESGVNSTFGNPAESVSFARWAKALRSYSSSSRLDDERRYWFETNSMIHPVPWGVDTPPRLKEENAQNRRLAFAADMTHGLLSDANDRYGTQPGELVLAALQISVSDLFPTAPVGIGIERHGRRPIGNVDPSTTVGWLTSFFPVVLQSAGAIGPSDTRESRLSEAVITVRKTLAAVPNEGIGYGLLRYLGSGDERSDEQQVGWTNPDIIFNYLGVEVADLSGRLRLIQSPQDGLRSARCERASLLEINSLVREGKLETYWRFDASLEGPVEILMARFEQWLGELIAHCRSSPAARHIPSDFPHAGLGQDDLDRLLGDLS